jgi:hypothetical protein
MNGCEPHLYEAGQGIVLAVVNAVMNLREFLDEMSKYLLDKERHSFAFLCIFILKVMRKLSLSLQ